MASTTKRVVPPQSPTIKPLPPKALVNGLRIATPPQPNPSVTIRPLPARAISTGATTTSSGNSGSNVLSEPIGHLIQHVKQYDPMLYEALQRLGTNTNVINDLVNNVNSQTQFYKRTIDIYDTTVGNSIAPIQPIYGSTSGDTQQPILVQGVLTQAITADLTLRINNIAAGVTTVVGEFTIPMATSVGDIVLFTSFTTGTMPFNSVLSFDITASDGSMSKYGVASYTLWWDDAS